MQPITANPADVLLTLAEIAIAFVGFASVVAIFEARWSQAEAPFDLFRFWVMLAFGLAGLLFSLLPLLLLFLGLSPAWVWRLSSLALAVFVVGNGAFIVRLYRRRVAAVVASLDPWLSAFANLSYALNLLAQLANVAGRLGGPGFGLYLFGLLMILLGAAVNFARLVWVGSASFGSPPD